MADNAPNEMEELLKRYAEKRRAQAGAPFELHPTDRQALQAEVARQYGQGRGAERRVGWLAWWPQLGLALGIFTVLGLVSWAVFHDSKQTGPANNFAKNTAKEPAKADGVKTGNQSNQPDATRSVTTIAPAIRPSERVIGINGKAEQPTVTESLSRRAVQDPGVVTTPLPPSPPKPAPVIADAAPAAARGFYGSTTSAVPPPAPSPALADAKQRELAAMATAAVGQQKELKDSEANTRAKAARYRAAGEAQTDNGAVASLAPKAEQATMARKSASADGAPSVGSVDLAASPEFAKVQAEGRGITEYYYALTKDAADKAPAPAPAPVYGGAQTFALRGASGAAGGGRSERPSGRLAPAETRMAMRAVAPGGQDSVRAEGVELGLAMKAAEKPVARQQYAILRETADARLKEAGQDGELLGAFEMEMSGGRIRIVDADGSVYEGTTQAEASRFDALAKPAAAKAKLAVEDAAKDTAIAGGQISFQASGNSRRLGQPVSISGTLFQDAPVQPVAQRENIATAYRYATLPATPAPPAAPTPPATVQPVQAQSAVPLKMRGFVRIGTGPERPLLAVPAQ
jgi:hypothetical protein